MKKIILILLLSSFYSINTGVNGEIIEKKTNLIKKKKFLNDSFPTTKLKGDLFFTIGALDSPINSQALEFTYENKIKIITSFDGSDKLLTVFESGNATSSPLNLDLQSKKGDNLKVSTLLYQFPINDNFQATIGPKMFGYNGLAGKSTLYNERIGILDGSNFTTSSGLGPGIGVSTSSRKGVNASFKLASNDEEIKNKSIHIINQIGYTDDNFGGTITANWNDEFNAFGIAAYYKHKYLPSISSSIEKKEGDNINSSENWIFALQKKFNGTNFGIAVGTYNDEENIVYESWSEIELADNLKLIPILFIRENTNKKEDYGFALSTKLTY